MKNIFKYSFVLLSAVVSLAFTSCVSEDDYASAEQVKGMQVFFPQSSAKFTPSEDGFYVVSVMRVDTTEEANVPLSVTAPEDCHYQVPESVKFEAGKNQADIVVTYDVSTIQPGKYESVTIAVGDASYTTPYGSSQFTFSAGIAPFEKVKGKKIKFRDGMIGPMYGLPAVEYELDYEVNLDNDSIIRIYKPYACQEYNDALYKAGVLDEPDEALKYYIDADDATDYMIVDLRNPKKVFFYSDDTGAEIRSGITFNSGDGQMSFISRAPFFKDSEKFFGTFEDGVLTMPKQSVLIKFDIAGGWYLGNDKGQFRILMPGAKAEDYSTWFEYSGSYTGLDGSSEVMGNVHFGADVASALVTVIPAGSYPTVDDVVTDMLEEKLPTQRITTDGGRANFKVEGAGSYTAVVASYSSDGEMQEISDTTFKFVPTGAPAQKWVALYEGDMEYGKQLLQGNALLFGNFVDNGLTLEALDGSDNTFRIIPFLDNGDEGLVFTMDAIDGNGIANLHVVESGTGVEYPNYGEEILVADPYEFSGQDPDFEDAIGYYDSKTDEFHFNLVYYISKGFFCIEEDVFTITDAVGTRKLYGRAASIKGSKKAPKRAFGKMNKNLKGKRVQFQLKKNFMQRIF